MRILLDTNIILDILLSRVPNTEPAEKIFEMIYQEKIRAYTTPAVSPIFIILQ